MFCKLLLRFINVVFLIFSHPNSDNDKIRLKFLERGFFYAGLCCMLFQSSPTQNFCCDFYLSQSISIYLQRFMFVHMAD